MTPCLSNVRVERTSAGTFEVCWEPDLGSLQVCVYRGTSPEAIDRRQPAACLTGGTCARMEGLDSIVRPYFEVVPEGADGVIVGERVVPLKNTSNFRDLGGYRSADGRRVRWGRIYRSDSLSSLDAGDILYLKKMGIRSVCDFRSEAEARRAPDARPADDSWQYLNLPVVMGAIDSVTAFERLQRGDASWFTADFMTAGYIRNLDRYPHVWGAAIKQVAQAENRPLVFHCSGGKDRAGTFAALLLLALKVPEQTVIRDYLLSNRLIAPRLEGFRKRIRSYGVDPRRIEPYLTAPPECIATLIAHLKERYGSAAEYLVDRAGVPADLLSTIQRDLLE